MAAYILTNSDHDKTRNTKWDHCCNYDAGDSARSVVVVADSEAEARLLATEQQNPQKSWMHPTTRCVAVTESTEKGVIGSR